MDKLMKKLKGKAVPIFLVLALCAIFVPAIAIASSPNGEAKETTQPDATQLEQQETSSASAALVGEESEELTEASKVMAGNQETDTVGEELNAINDGVEAQLMTAATDEDSEDSEEDSESKIEKHEATSFEKLEQLINDASKSSIRLGEPGEIVVERTLTINRPITIEAVDGVTLTRTAQNYSIFKIENNGSLTLNNVKLQATETAQNINGTTDLSPIVSAGNLTMVNSSISGFVASDGGGLTVESGTVYLDNSNIDNNQARNMQSFAQGGGINIKAGSVELVNGSSVSNNTADSAYSRSRNGGEGGGIFAAKNSSLRIKDSFIRNNAAGHREDDRFDSVKNGIGGGLFISSGCAFELSGKESCVEGNAAYAWGNRNGGGGGIYVANSGENTHITEGTIRNNISYGPGGGIYALDGKLSLQKVLIAQNSTELNSSDGGGVWFCPSGVGVFHATNGCVITNNIAGKSGADFSSWESWPAGKDLKLSSYLPDGTKIKWIYDARDWDGNLRDLPSGMESDTDLDFYIGEYGVNNNVHLQSEVAYNAEDYSLIIENNAASEGGGIACNGNLVMGEDKDISLTIQKKWQGASGGKIQNSDDLPESITVEVYNRDKKIDEVVLNDDNSWQTTLEGLPFDGVYTVKEAGESSEGYTVSYKYSDGEKEMTSIAPTEGTSEYFVDITNTKQPTEGSLTINKTLTGSIYKMGDGNGRGSVTAVFHIVGTRAGNPGEEIYNNYVGMDFTEAGEETLTLNHLPVGDYTVTEVIPPNSGFEVSGDIEQTGTLLEKDLEFSFTNVTTDTESPSEGSVNRYTFVSDEDGAVKTIYKRIVNNFNILQQETN